MGTRTQSSDGSEWLASRVAVAALLTCLWSPAAAAQGDWSKANGARKSLTVPRVEGPPKLDGFLDDPQWASAATVDNLTLYLPLPGQVPTQATGFYFYFDDDALYLGAQLNEVLLEPFELLGRAAIAPGRYQFDRYRMGI
jgi:hypothetical protein